MQLRNKHEEYSTAGRMDIVLEVPEKGEEEEEDKEDFPFGFDWREVILEAAEEADDIGEIEEVMGCNLRDNGEPILNRRMFDSRRFDDEDEVEVTVEEDVDSQVEEEKMGGKIDCVEEIPVYGQGREKKLPASDESNVNVNVTEAEGGGGRSKRKPKPSAKITGEIMKSATSFLNPSQTQAADSRRKQRMQLLKKLRELEFNDVYLGMQFGLEGQIGEAAPDGTVVVQVVEEVDTATIFNNPPPGFSKKGENKNEDNSLSIFDRN